MVGRSRRVFLGHKSLKDFQKVWLLDANDRLIPDLVADRTGPVHDGLSVDTVAPAGNNATSRGTVFAAEIEKHHMWAPSTFEQFAASSDVERQGAFKASVERGARIDYILLSDTVDAKPASARVLHECDLRNLSDDHLPVILAFQLQPGAE